MDSNSGKKFKYQLLMDSAHCKEHISLYQNGRFNLFVK